MLVFVVMILPMVVVMIHMVVIVVMIRMIVDVIRIAMFMCMGMIVPVVVIRITVVVVMVMMMVVVRRSVSLFHPGLTRRAVQAPGRRVSRTRAIAAPKPLSMFTTVTPAAQLDSMPSSAAMPPSEAP